MSKRIKAVTIWEPWATLIMAGVKQFETRHWRHGYRGPLVIHASLRWRDDQRTIVTWHPYRELLAALDWTPEQTLGCCLGIVDLVKIWPTTNGELQATLSDQERKLGDFRPQRFAWQFTNPRRFEKPVAAKGAQSLWYWNLTAEAERLLKKEKVT